MINFLSIENKDFIIFVFFLLFFYLFLLYNKLKGDRMKKLLLVILLIFISGCGALKTYDEVSYKKLNSMLDKKENFILFIGSSTCSACSSYKITLNKVVKKYGVDIKYIDLSMLSDKEKGDVNAKFPISGTPATIFIEKGIEKDTYNRIDGNVRYSKIVEKLKENGYVKE